MMTSKKGRKKNKRCAREKNRESASICLAVVVCIYPIVLDSSQLATPREREGKTMHGVFRSSTRVLPWMLDVGQAKRACAYICVCLCVIELLQAGVPRVLSR